MRTQEGRGRGRGSQEWFPELEVPVGMLSWTQRQGDDSAGTKGERCPWDGQKAAVIPSQLLGNCKGRGVKMQQTPAEGWWPGPSRCEGGSRCGWLWEGSRIGGGQPPSFPAASGAKSQDEVGGPQGSLGRASLSGPLGPWPQGGPQSRHRRHQGGGRGRGLHAPRKGAGKISVNPRRAPVGGNEQGSSGSGAPRPQVTRAQGHRGDAGPVPAREPKSEGSEGAGIPSAHARYSPGSAPSGIRSVQSRSAGSGLLRGLCPAESELAPVGARDTLSPDPERPRSGTCGVRSGREGPLSPAPRASR